MITNDELNTLRFSPTNKDYYQIWGELLDTAAKLSERWDPSSTNESDPGIILLKVLTAIADKLNYNIDKNILEAFMPTAAQEDSMRRLCDMLGYSIKYYQSATADITIHYNGDTTDLSDENEEKLPLEGLVIPAFTPISTTEKDIYYITTARALLTNSEPVVTVPSIEGQRIHCELSNDSVITIANLDDNNRFYLPELKIAENGIFVYNTSNGETQTRAWKKVDNLNTVASGSKVYTFGFDSKENRPYLQFPSDVSFLIEDGLDIYYIRTSGAAGNVSANTLTTFEKPTISGWENYADSEFFVVTNPDAALNGKNPETIDQAYEGFKKTIGTFDTLVTCRDYMNKIYQLVDSQNRELVSNIIVSDIRDDINRAHVLCSFSDYGIVYTEKANEATSTTPELDHFDLVLYPFKTYKNLHTAEDYSNSFKYSDANLAKIKTELKNYKTISHNFVQPTSNEIVCIKNYLKLNARISTINKVNIAEESIILATVRSALYNEFNMRKLDFGEEIPYEAIVKCIENADPRIRSVALDEPILYTKFLCTNGREYGTASTTSGTDSAQQGRKLYNKLALKNILAGRIELFNYDLSFKQELGEAAYPGVSPIYENVTRIETICTKKAEDDTITLLPNEVIKLRAPNFKTVESLSAYINYYLKLNLDIKTEATPARFLSLKDIWLQPVIKDKMPFANYFLYELLTNPKLAAYLSTIEYETNVSATTDLIIATRFYNDYDAEQPSQSSKDGPDLKKNIEEAITVRGCWYLPSSTAPTGSPQKADLLAALAENAESSLQFLTRIPVSGIQPGYYYLSSLTNDDTLFTVLNNVLQDLADGAVTFARGSEAIWNVDNTTADYWRKGIYRQLAPDTTRNPGLHVDAGQNKYMLCKTTPKGSSQASGAGDIYFVIAPWKAGNYELSNAGWIATTKGNSEGVDAELEYIEGGEEYQLKNGEYLFINYTPSSTTSTSEQATSASVLPVNKVFGEGTILRPNAATKLYDSETLHNTSGMVWRKTTGFDFSRYATGIVFDGMFSVGANEQIDIRDFMEVNLNDSIMYLYWVLNKDRILEITDASKEKPGSAAFTLEEGEYIFYTDRNKLSMSYYGNGTEVIFRSTINRKIELLKDSFAQIDFESILTNGISAIPWRAYNFGSSYYIKLREYQYIVLGAGDRLNNIGLDEINGEWQALPQSQPQPSYILGETETLLPKFRIKNPEDLSDIHWEAKSFLELDVGPEKAQTLNPGNEIKLYTAGSDEAIPLKPNENVTLDLAFKTNYNYQSAGGNIYTNSITGSEGIDFKLKTIAETPVVTKITTISTNFNNPDEPNAEDTSMDLVTDSPVASQYNVINRFSAERWDIDNSEVIKPLENHYANCPVSLYNFNTLWTLINTDNFSLVQGGFTQDNLLNPKFTYISAPTTVPDKQFNIMMVYYQPPDGIMQRKIVNDTVVFDGAGFRFKYLPAVAKQPTPPVAGASEEDIIKYQEAEAAWELYNSRDKDGFVVDTACEKIKIYNNLKVDTDGTHFLSKALTNPSSTTIDFTNYFDNLQWWTNGEISTDFDKNEESATAFGYKQLYLEVEQGETQSTKPYCIDSVYYLRPGINMIVYQESGVFEFFTDASGSSTLFIGTIDSVKLPSHAESLASLGLNIDLLDYQYSSETSALGDNIAAKKLAFAEVELLNDIFNIDKNKEFYYNCPLQVASAIDINTALIDSADRETLSDAKFWYDKNNINNKFVISEIDAEYLKTGIVIAKASKLR